MVGCWKFIKRYLCYIAFHFWEIYVYNERLIPFSVWSLMHVNFTRCRIIYKAANYLLHQKYFRSIAMLVQNILSSLFQNIMKYLQFYQIRNTSIWVWLRIWCKVSYLINASTIKTKNVAARIISVRSSSPRRPWDEEPMSPKRSFSSPDPPVPNSPALSSLLNMASSFSRCCASTSMFPPPFEPPPPPFINPTLGKSHRYIRPLPSQTQDTPMP